MSLLKRIIGAIKPYRDEEVPEPEPFGLTAAAVERLETLRPGWGVIVSRPGTELLIREGATCDRVTVDGVEPEDLRGLLLDYDNGWRVALDLTVRAAETPNPNSRLYTLSRRIARGAASSFTRSTINPPLPESLLCGTEVQSVLLRGNTITIERIGSDCEWQDLDAKVDRVVRDYLINAGPIVESVSLRYHDSFTAEVAAIIESDILPTVHRDGGDLQLVEVRDGVVRLAMRGACRSCPSSSDTLHRGVASVLERRLGKRIRRVEAV